MSAQTGSRRAWSLVPALATAILASLVMSPSSAGATSSGRALPEVVAVVELTSATGAVHDIGVGGALPSDATCAARVRPTAENRPANVPFNNTRGNSPNNETPRVTGNFVGTTDEIIQWASCKWGLDVSWARHQAALESYWRQNDTFGDFGTDPAACLPGHPIGADGRPGECPQSIGLLQVRYPYHRSAFENNNAIRSTAYNADYAWSVWRRCFEGQYAWLNDVERGRTYAAGDGLGCMGVWFSGRWYTSAAVGYMNRISTAGTSIPPPATGRSLPSEPRSLTVAVAPTVGAGQIRLSWAAPAYAGSPGFGDYTIQRSADEGRTWVTLSDGVNVNRTILLSGYRLGHRYWFRIAARNALGNSRWSLPIHAVPRALPSAPRSLTIESAPTVGAGQIRLRWVAPAFAGSPGFGDYTIYRRLSGSTVWSIAPDPGSTSPTYVGPGSNAAGVRYRFCVRARNGIGHSPCSNEVGTPAAAVITTSRLSATIAPTTTTVAPATSITTSAPAATSTTIAPTSSSTTVASTTTTTSVPPSTSTTVAPTTEAPTTTIAAETTVATIPMPPLQAMNCPAIGPGDAQRVSDALLDGPDGATLTVLVASTGFDGPTQYIVGSIFDSNGSRVSTADAWAVVDGELLALSAGANQYSDGLPDAASVLTGPAEGINSPVQLDLVACVTAALG